MHSRFWTGLALVFAFVTAARADDFEEGKWKMTMVTTTNGRPAVSPMDRMKPMPLLKKGQKAAQEPAGEIVTQCLTNANPVPPFSVGYQNCQETHQLSGDTATFHIACDMKGTQAQWDGTITCSQDVMQGHVNWRTTTRGISRDSTINITGQYVSPCDR